MKQKRIIKALKTKETFLISTHVSPDPDALCSELAMAAYLRSIGKKVHIVNEAAVPRRYDFLPGVKRIKPLSKVRRCSYDAAIVLDCGELSRIGDVQKLLDPQKPLINIDHHVTNDTFGSLNVVQPRASSTAAILYELLKEAKCKFTKNIAELLYIGIMTDTGSFRYENTSAKTHAIVSELMKFSFSPYEIYKRIYESIPRMDLKLFTKIISTFDLLYSGKVVALNLRKRLYEQFSESFDLRDMIFRFLRTIEGVEVLVIFTEVGRKRTRVNLRSSGRVNVAKIAFDFHGGGHRRASGCVIEKDLKTARNKVLRRIKKDI